MMMCDGSTFFKQLLFLVIRCFQFLLILGYKHIPVYSLCDLIFVLECIPRSASVESKGRQMFEFFDTID